MKKLFLSVLTLMFLTLVGCASSETSGEGTSGSESDSGSGSGDDTLTIAWYPNESGGDLKEARQSIGKMVEEATGKKVEHKTTTDYIIAIEALANGNADVAYMGAQGYIEAHKKNEDVKPLAVSSGESGTLKDAQYYSWLAVKEGNMDNYKNGEEFSIDNIAGKSFSFVSQSSTSGFKVPSAGIVSHFSEMDKYSELTQEDLLKGGEFFSQVQFGGSHQGSAVNLITGKTEVAAFCDVCVGNYVENVEGEHNRPGAVYSVAEDAAEPFSNLAGERFGLISVTPVLNAPFAMNTNTLSEDTQKTLVDAFTSDETANNEEIFVPEDSSDNALFYTTGKERFVKVEDSWFDPIRELSK
ncbi:phosphate/phosphite/phosphonate ABC transporter substrate-binding protein [Halobacillus sp. B29]|uniref:phosphate/phosphite/phosphonate ABC transporter substrate-binding protein n=1 Tax=Halobacillus sp. B29 TaxID=3457432 RepID=UPI003FCE3CED